MVINMGTTLFFMVIITVSIVQGKPSLEHNVSNEGINMILDKFIQETDINVTTNPTSDINDGLISTVDPQSGNDSNIYYFKTQMAPNINFKSSNELLQVTTEHFNKTDHSHELENQDHLPTLDDDSDPDNNNIVKRKSFVDINNHDDPTTPFGEEDPNHSGYRSGNINENDILDDLKKEIVSNFDILKDQNQEDKNQETYNTKTQREQQLKLLHNYPEIIIDHITYDNPKNHKEPIDKIFQMNTTPDTQQPQNETNIEFKNHIKPAFKPHIKPKEDIEIDDTNKNLEPEKHLTSEMKGLIEAIVEKKVLHDNLSEKNTEKESRKQSLLLEKILHKLPEKQHTRNKKASYSVRHEIIAPSEINRFAHLHNSLDTLHRNIGHVKVLPNKLQPHKWGRRNHRHNRLRSKVLRIYRPEELERSRVRARYIDRILSKIDYQPIYYDIYKK